MFFFKAPASPYQFLIIDSMQKIWKDLWPAKGLCTYNMHIPVRLKFQVLPERSSLSIVDAEPWELLKVLVPPCVLSLHPGFWPSQNLVFKLIFKREVSCHLSEENNNRSSASAFENFQSTSYLSPILCLELGWFQDLRKFDGPLYCSHSIIVLEISID